MLNIFTSILNSTSISSLSEAIERLGNSHRILWKKVDSNEERLNQRINDLERDLMAALQNLKNKDITYGK